MFFPARNGLGVSHYTEAIRCKMTTVRLYKESASLGVENFATLREMPPGGTPEILGHLSR